MEVTKLCIDGHDYQLDEDETIDFGVVSVMVGHAPEEEYPWHAFVNMEGFMAPSCFREKHFCILEDAITRLLVGIRVCLTEMKPLTGVDQNG